MKATVGHPQNWPREALKNNFTSLVEMIGNHGIASHIHEITLKERKHWA